MPNDQFRVWPGVSYPLGAVWDGTGVNFAVFSENAEAVEVCLFDERGRREIARLRLPEYTDGVWHGYMPDLRPGQLYGLRVQGPYQPERGHRFNVNKLLLDPYAKALCGAFLWHDTNFGYRVGSPKEDMSFDRRDNARCVPKCVVVDDAFTWGDDRPPRTPWHETVIYEMHVRGFTMQAADVPKQARGTMAGLAAPSVTRYLKSLGITSVELLPVHAFVDEGHLVSNGRRNYWGYNSIGFFAPEPRYLAGGDLGEFKTGVRALHDAGIEVILDVVYNHTAEGNEMGPTYSFRGIDNASYYHLRPGQERYYEDFTGCGNALNLQHPRVLQLVMDSLRYWVEVMHVDGFRFDLATTLARQNGEFDSHAGFLDAIRQDPVLSHVNLIAEPWDVGANGYQVGGFPPGWAEWNDQYRDVVRRFWRGDEGLLGQFASRITGSSDIFERHGRRPWASINFITAHDGFTLNDLVSYNEKHNEANGEDNRDGHNENYSWNCGVEGPTDDPEIAALRDRQKRNLLATLILSQGVPMLLAGDEMGRTKNGNNNTYCQDNELNWIDWERGADHALIAYVQRLLRLRHRHIVFHRSRYLLGRPLPGNGAKDITWYNPDGGEKTPEDWENGNSRFLAFQLNGEAGEYHLTRHGDPEPDDTFLVAMNADPDAVRFRLPQLGEQGSWTRLLDTSHTDGVGERTEPEAGEIDLPGRVLMLWILQAGSA